MLLWRRVREYRITQLLTRGFICGKLILGVCSLYSTSAVPMSHSHRPLNKPSSALVCLSFCRYLQVLLSQLGTAARREAVLGWPLKHIHDPFGCGQDTALSSRALQRVPCVSHLWSGWHKVVGSGFLEIV